MPLLSLRAFVARRKGETYLVVKERLLPWHTFPFIFCFIPDNPMEQPKHAVGK
jgi:hypothetical protein